MNKLFAALLFLTLVGAGILFWLMKSMPTSPSSADSHGASEKAEVISTPEGVQVGDLAHEGGDQHGSDHGAESGHSDSKKDAHASNEKDSHGSAKEHEEAHAPARTTLSIATTPVLADVFVDGEQKGQTPLEFELGEKAQTVKLVADGFNEVVKTVPAQGKENLKWNIALRAKKGALVEPPHRNAPTAGMIEGKGALAALPKARTAHAAPVKEHKEEAHGKAEDAKPAHAASVAAANDTHSSDLYLRGRGGPVWVQIKSMEAPSEAAAVKEIVDPQIEKFRKDLTGFNVVGCQVQIPNKGRWVRVLVGPFESKAEAKTNVTSIKNGGGADAFVTGAQTCL